MSAPLVLVSHALCPYVQRVAITLSEKGVAFERRDIDLADKPAWFLQLSPTGKTPMLQVGRTVLFESAAICEYLEETHLPALHPRDALRRAQHRAWMEFASGLLARIAALYGAADDAVLDEQLRLLRHDLQRVEGTLGAEPYFEGAAFSLVDAAFAPVWRYFDALERGGIDALDDLPKIGAWRSALMRRDSVRTAVADDYPHRLMAFLLSRGSALSRRFEHAARHVQA